MTLPTYTHAQWRSILYPLAKAAVERGEFGEILKHHQLVADKREHFVGLVANYAATDMVLSGRTHMLSMDEVRAALRAEPEEWRAIPGYEGLYEASNFGRVRSFYRDRRILSAKGTDETGYPVVSLTKDGKRHTYTLHRLICRTFHGEPCPDKPETAHLDGSRTNCRADNLQWVTKLENEAHKQRHGTDQRTIAARQRRAA